MKATENTRILVTGFGPYGRVKENPSQVLAERSGHPFTVLEVAYQAADEFVNRLDPNSFDIWLMLGVADSRKRMSLELFARNSVTGADARGTVTPGRIDNTAPLLLDSTLWTPRTASHLIVADSNILHLSMDAGAFLCNYLSFKGILRFPEKQVGFLHVVMPETISLDDQAAAIERFVVEITR